MSGNRMAIAENFDGARAIDISCWPGND